MSIPITKTKKNTVFSLNNETVNTFIVQPRKPPPNLQNPEQIYGLIREGVRSQEMCTIIMKVVEVFTSVVTSLTNMFAYLWGWGAIHEIHIILHDR